MSYLTARLDRFGLGDCGGPDTWLSDDGNTCYYTSEGKAAVEEAIGFLGGQASKPALVWSQGVTLAAQYHVNGNSDPMYYNENYGH